MKIRLTIFALALGICASAQTPDNVYSVTACPAEDASTGMRISWAADTTVTNTFVLVTEENARNWRKALMVKPEQMELCTTFDSVYSKLADGSNFYEDVKFLKCGAAISDLKPDTQYKYVICAGDKAKKCKELSTVHHFKTAGASEWSACIISDYHSYPPLGGRLVAAMDMIGKVREYDPGMDWVLHVGDICAWGGSYSFWKRMYQEKPFEDWMWAGVNGNHDNMTRLYKLTNHFFRDTDYYPRNGYEGEEGVCYWFRYGDALFIMLNNEDMGGEEGLFPAQRWVKKVVTEQKASANPPQYIIVAEHYQWFNGRDGGYSQYNRWHELFDELGVDLALAGNNHIYVRTGALFDGKKTDGSYGTVYMQTSSADNERGQGFRDVPMKNADKIEYRFTEGGRTISAISMKVNPEGMKFALLDREGTILDEAYIPAKKEKVTKPDIRGNYLRDSLDVMAARCQDVLNAAYMAEKYLGTNDSIPGWEGFPVKLYEYWTGVDSRINAKKKALVYMLNPDARKMARWIVNAVYDVTGDVKYEDLEKVRKFIKWQSGGQFPVKGVVYEAMYKPGEYYPYIFKDGVTVYMKDEEHWKAADENPTEEQLQFYLNMSNSDLKDYTGRYGRIISTNREMYYNAGGTDKVGKDDERIQAWLDTVAKLYKEAWNSDRNFLIYAWTKYAFEHPDKY